MSLHLSLGSPAPAASSASAALYPQQSPIAQVLVGKQQMIDRLYDQSLSGQAKRVKDYVSANPEVVFCKSLSTVLGCAACGAGIGAAAGAVVGAAFFGAGAIPGATFGAVTGAGGGALVGFKKAYEAQKSDYRRWLNDKKNMEVNNEVMGIIRHMIEKKRKSGDDKFQHFLDPINFNLMERPVLDMSTGQIFDLSQHEERILETGVSPFNAHQKMKIKDLQVLFATQGRIKKLCSAILQKEVEGIVLNPNQQSCVQKLVESLEKDAVSFYHQANTDLQDALTKGQITRKQHAARLGELADVLDPVAL